MRPHDLAACVGAAPEQYPALGTLMGAYFHQDCLLDDPDDVAVIERFARDCNSSELLEARRQLAQVLELPLSDEQLGALIAVLDCYYYPEAGQFRTWLVHVQATLARLAS